MHLLLWPLERILEPVLCSAVLSSLKCLCLNGSGWSECILKGVKGRKIALWEVTDKYSVKDRAAELQDFSRQLFPNYIPPVTSLICHGWTFEADSHGCYYFCLNFIPATIKENSFIPIWSFIEPDCFDFLGREKIWAKEWSMFQINEIPLNIKRTCNRLQGFVHMLFVLSHSKGLRWLVNKYYAVINVITGH